MNISFSSSNRQALKVPLQTTNYHTPQQNMVTEIKLGLCNPPEPIYLYVNQGEVDGESYVWYKFNISQDKKIPVTQRALTGYLSELRLTTKEFKGKDNLKLDIVVSADELYVIRTGVETNFAKSFLLAASLIQDFSKPLIIVANAGDENTVFCNLYDAATKTKIYREWSRDLDWATIIHDIQFRLGSNLSTISDIHDITVESLYRVGVTEVDGIIAGLPCPPFSLAGKRKASQDERNLFGEFFRVLCEIRPQWAIVENVPGLITAESGEFFRAVLWEFAQMGFDVQWGIVSAASVGAVHFRERVWIIATNSQSPRWGTSWNQYSPSGANPASVGGGDAGKSQKHRLTNSVEYAAFSQPASSRGDDWRTTGLDGCLLGVTGLDSWLASATIPSFNRLTRGEIAALTQQELAEYRQLYAEYQAIRRQHKQQLIALGNAIVPQCAALIFGRLKTILSR